MSKFNDYFFNDSVFKISNKYFKFNRYGDNDNITIITNNIISLGDWYVLLVGDNRGVWLKNWQVKPCKVGQNTYIPSYAVKLNRKYFTVKDIDSYKCDDFCFEKENDFDDMVRLAKVQDERDEAISIK